TLGSKRDLNFHLYADFMRDRLNSKSSIVDTFSYSDIFKVGYLVGDYYETEGIDIMSLFDDNEIIVGTDSYSMDFAEFSNLSGSSVDAEDEVYMKFPAQIEGMAEGGDVMVPISWASDEFFLGGLRAGTDRICLLSPWSDAVYRVWSNDVVIRDSSLNDGVVSCFNLSVSSTSAVRISSNVSVLGYYHGTSDSYPLYPASNGEFYGIASENAYLTTGPLSSRVKARNISGTTFFDSVIAQNDVEHFSEVGPGGSATAYRVDSENFIGMIQQDDGDGAESSLFTPRHEMGTIFGSIQPLQYLSIVSPYDDAICLVYNASGDIVVGYVDTTPEMNFFYPANNNASDSVLDKSGKGNDLVVGNGAPTWVSGASFDGSGAFEFDGNGEYYEVPDGENYINGLSEFTVSVWIKADQIGTDRPIFDSEMPDEQDDVFGLRYDVSGFAGGCVDCFKAAIATSDQGANVVQIESSSDLQKTTWQHVAFRWKSGQQLELFIDGLHDLGSYASGIGTGTLIGSDRLMIGNGAKGSLSGNSWDGMIDEFRFFPSYLSDDQVYNLYLNDFSQYVNFTQAKGSNGVYQYEFGTNDSNILVDNGWILKCDREVWPYFEDGNDDESNLFGYKQMRQYVYPRPYVVVNDVPIEINWTSLDIGSVNAWGKYYFDDGAYIVEASGQNTTSSSDEFHYLALSEESDFNVTVKVSDLDGNGPESKAGIMFREDLLADSKFAGIFLTSGNGLTFEWREFSSGNANFENLTGVSDPVWLRLVRENDNFSGFYSNDGVNWNFLEDATIAMDSQYNYGLAVTSNQDGNITRAVFENFDSN
ncbi:MAG: LamG-like jellyroll fold domain-containing protein, partial [Nanoarchaeota archaeon]